MGAHLEKMEKQHLKHMGSRRYPKLCTDVEGEQQLDGGFANR